LEAFYKIEEHMSNPLVLLPSQGGISFILYIIIVAIAMGAMLTQKIKGAKGPSII